MDDVIQHPGDWTKQYRVLIDLMIQIGLLKIRPLVVYWPKTITEGGLRFGFSLMVVRWMNSDSELSLFSVTVFEHRWSVSALFLFGFNYFSEEWDEQENE